jgi:hypothetical protein
MTYKAETLCLPRGRTGDTSTDNTVESLAGETSDTSEDVQNQRDDTEDLQDRIKVHVSS